MRRGPRLIRSAIALSALLTFAARSVAAQGLSDEVPHPRRPPPDLEQSSRSMLASPPAAGVTPLPSEGNIVAGQLAIATLTMFAAFGAVFALGYETKNYAVADTLLLASPIASGLTVCAVGGNSRYYQGGCGASVGGAYIGAFALAIPLFALALIATQPSPDGGSEVSAGLVVTAFLGFVVGAAIGGTVGWHLGKQRRDERAAVPAPPRPLVMEDHDWSDLRPRTPARAAATFSVPLLTLRF